MTRITKYGKGEIIGNNGVVFIEEIINKAGRRKATFKCPLCEKYFITTIKNIKSGNTKSCGCLKIKLISKNFRRHYLKGTKLYRAWQNMKNRCLNKNVESYSTYGGRGIKIYEEWLDKPTTFVEYCKTLDSWDNPDLTIDRIDNDGNYEPGNMRFATHFAQANNKKFYKNNTSGYTGVYWNKFSKNFIAAIYYNNMGAYLGRHKTKAEAVAARNKYIIKNNLPLNKIQTFNN